ncbi:MAG: hypothetical protein J6T62_09520 [Fibrobacter sp.]|nr:hypothetical protein [Fibrobacter sp.]
MKAGNWNFRHDRGTSAPKGCSGGFTLPLALVILAVMGNIALVIFSMVKSERVESFRRYTKIQAELNIESGIDFALNKMETESSPWRTDSLHYISPDSSVTFTLSHFQDGIYSKLSIVPRDSSQKTATGIASPWIARAGFRRPPLPAIIVLSRRSNFAIAQGTRIKGGIAVAEGSVSYSMHYLMMADRETYYDTVFTDTNFTLFDSLRYFPELSRNQFDSLYKKDLCEFDARDEIPQTLSCRNVIVQGDAHCEKCSIRAEKIRIRGNSVFKEADIRANKISATEYAELSGTFFARDSVFVELERTQDAPLTIALQGRKSGPFEYSGSLDLEKLSAGNVQLLFIGDNWEESLPGIPVRISEKSNLKGIVVSMGTTDFQGHLKGTLVTYNFGFIEGGTHWKNFVRHAKIENDSTASYFLPDMLHLGGLATYEKM